MESRQETHHDPAARDSKTECTVCQPSFTNWKITFNCRATDRRFDQQIFSRNFSRDVVAAATTGDSCNIISFSEGTGSNAYDRPSRRRTSTSNAVRVRSSPPCRFGRGATGAAGRFQKMPGGTSSSRATTSCIRMPAFIDQKRTVKRVATHARGECRAPGVHAPARSPTSAKRRICPS